MAVRKAFVTMGCRLGYLTRKRETGARIPLKRRPPEPPQGALFHRCVGRFVWEVLQCPGRVGVFGSCFAEPWTYCSEWRVLHAVACSAR